MPLRETAPKLSPETYEQNFADITPPMNARQAAIEAARCLYCFDAPCIQACPTRIDVPGFIKRIMTANVRGAARVILEANILGESCGRVCPTEVLCEGACVMVEKGEKAIEIGRLQRFAVDHVLDRKIQLVQAGKPNGFAFTLLTRNDVPVFQQTAELLKAIAREHTVVVVEHDMAFVRDLGVKVTCLHEGSVLAEGTIDQVSANERVVEVYLGR